ncbi:Cyclin-dependent kinase [Paramyrothecium foliicola]|nr:Cyclin-dependent kinase [Paramyrothecium foliicola]
MYRSTPMPIALPDSAEVFVSDSDTSTEDFPQPHPVFVKQRTLSSSRPIEENFQIPKRRYTFPRLRSREHGLFSPPWQDDSPKTLFVSKRRNTEPLTPKSDWQSSKKMACPYDTFCNRLNTYCDERFYDQEQKWLFATCFKGLLGKDDIVALLKAKRDKSCWRVNPADLAVYVRDRASLLFMMLVHTGYDELLEKFYLKDIRDTDFPLAAKFGRSNVSFQIGERQVQIDLGQMAPRNVRALFDHYQWEFFVPALQWLRFDHAPFNDKTELPYLERIEKSRTAFSIVDQAVVHSDHIKLQSQGLKIQKNREGHPVVALKRLIFSGLTKQDFHDFIKAEYETLDLLRSFKTRHLIKAAAFYRKEDCYFVFPWAEHGNLRNFWKEKMPKIHDNKYMEWVFSQLLEISDAIKALHDKQCRHGDLKPENILCFNAAESKNPKDHTSCVLVISDVGLSRSHNKLTQFRSRTRMLGGETIAYAAPETELFPQKATSRRYDIWSLGCLFLEFAIWLLYGNKELEQMSKDIGKRFYQILDKKHALGADGVTARAELSPVVKQWMQKLKMDARSAKSRSNETAMSRLVLLIEERLLVINATPDTAQGVHLPSRRNDSNFEFPLATREQVDSPHPQFILRQPTYLEKKSDNNTMENERAYAPEMCRKLRAIVDDARNGAIEWMNPDYRRGQITAGHGYERDAGLFVPAHKDSAGKNQELDDQWEYVSDSVITQRIRPSLQKLSESHVPSKLCLRCQALPIWSRDCSFNDTVAGLKKNSYECDLCKLLSDRLALWVTLPDETLNFFRVGSCLKFNNAQLPPLTSLCILPKSEDDKRLQSSIQLGFPSLPEAGGKSHINLLRAWIEVCDETHQCLVSQDEPFLPTRLLDVGRKGSKRIRLICETNALDKGEKYIAVSHRWGASTKPGEFDYWKEKTICLYENNIRRLEAGVDDSEFPPKYRDAITISRELGVRYVWIDSLCIIQYNREDPLNEAQGQDWAREAERMEQVFRSAYVTLAASCAASPAEHFLKPRAAKQFVTIQLGNALYYVGESIDNFVHDVEAGGLMKRGWVFQERALSRRTVFFTQKQTYWECGDGIRCETLTRTKKPSLLGDANFPYSIPDYVKGMKIKLYQDLYERYSRLALSYVTDRPTAILGLERRLLRALNTKGAYGILEIYLRRGLLWQRERETLRRIDFSGETKPRQPVPSWSWMAYVGPIRYMNVPFGKTEWTPWDQDVVATWCEAGNGGGVRLELHILVRDITDVEPGARVFLDDPGYSFDNPFKCVVVGSSKTSRDGERQVYYALIVVRAETRGEGLFERAGVEFLHRSQIVWETPAEGARLV